MRPFHIWIPSVSSFGYAHLHNFQPSPLPRKEENKKLEKPAKKEEKSKKKNPPKK